MYLTGTVVFWRDDKGFGFIVAEPSQEKYFFHIRDLNLQDGALNNAPTIDITAPNIEINKTLTNNQKEYRPKVGDQLNFQQGTDKQGRRIAAPWQPSAECLAQASIAAIKQDGATSSATSSKQQAKNAYNKPSLNHSQQQNIDIQHTKEIALFFRLGFFVLFIIAVLFGTLPYLLPILYLEASLFTYWLYRSDKQAAIARQRDRLPEQSLQLFSLIGGWPGAYIAQKKLSHKSSKWLFQREFALIILANTILVIWLISSSGQDFFGQFAFFAR